MLLITALMVLACGDGSVARSGEPEAASPAEGCAHVEEVSVTSAAAGVYDFTVTVRSSDTGWEKYADAWEVRDESGAVLGTRELLHPHVDEQPFTRGLADVEVPAGVRRVEIAARDSVAGFCGETMLVDLP